MVISIMHNPRSGRYILSILNGKDRATVDTIYLTQVIYFIQMMHTMSPVQLSFHVSITEEARETITTLIRSNMAS